MIEVTQPLFKVTMSAPQAFQMKITQTVLQGPPGPDGAAVPRSSFQMISSLGNIFTITLAEDPTTHETSFIATPSI